MTGRDGTGYRLPSEAEWEFACREGTATKYWSGDLPPDLTRAGWFVKNSGGRTHAVGELQANPFGLFDIHGNAWEWVQDGWEPNNYSQFQEQSSIDPHIPSLAASAHVFRGGGWDSPASICRSPYRHAAPPPLCSKTIGFRALLPVNAVREALKPTVAADPDRRAAEWVLSVGGRVWLKDQAGEIAAVNDLPTQAFQLDHINLHGCTKVTEAGFALFKDCKQVTSQHLVGASFDETWLAHFAHFKELTNLNLGFTNVTDAALAHFKDCKKLESLDLTHVPVGDVGLSYVKDCRELVHVNLDGTRVTDDGLAQLKNCRKLTGLNVMHTQVGDAGLSHFKDFELTVLFAGFSRVTDAGLANFGRCERLEWLDLRDLPMTDAGLANFKEAKSLTQLNLTNTNIGDGTLQTLQPCRQLAHAQLGGTRVSDKGLAHLKESKNLMTLNLNATTVGDDGLEALTELRKLGELDLRKTKATETGVKKLSAALPGCKIEWDGGVIEGGQK